jgi:hypothetical protein
MVCGYRQMKTAVFLLAALRRRFIAQWIEARDAFCRARREF